MLCSTEVRWFYEGVIPELMLKWFDQFNPEDQDPRTDYYFIVSGTEHLGIKLREGNLQIKTRVADLGVVELPGRLEGEIVNYEKWSFPVVSNEEWATLITRPEVWIPVKKSRLLIRYTLGGGFPNKIDLEEQGADGCEVELSRIEVYDKAFWTLAFEAFGNPADLHLEKTLHEIFENTDCPVFFPKEKSFGYARLISDIEH